ncbi:uridine phosphorylase 1-like [Diabrotica virgifera virgifera]|uniref:Nucleoside phosphorylase domain-containing protein n=1 Tax=Diabrotica virgifera virgifera TaxID=50390 RepID=A0ABM5KFZ4_DIAVI|nr:uridine phosphorylase 1-like [Diabrotica virgifera virgifera]
MAHNCACSENAVKNPHLARLDNDYLYHIALDTETMNLVEAFGDTKFICMGGSPKKMYLFAKYIMKEIGHKLPFGTKLLDISEKGDRYCMYKVGPVVSVNHGMGCPTMGILLNELIKLMYYAKCKNPMFFRLGTCGGIGSKPGTVIISEDACDGMLQKEYHIPVLGKIIKRSTELDKELCQELKSLSSPDDDFQVISGITMCTNDFYEGQARTDGAFCEYKVKEQMNYLRSLQSKNIVNIEMESTAFAAFTKAAGIRSGVICLNVRDVLEGDKIYVSKELINKWQARTQILVARYINKHLN